MKKYVQIEGKEYLNVATMNFMDLVGDERIEVSFLNFLINDTFEIRN